MKNEIKAGDTVRYKRSFLNKLKCGRELLNIKGRVEGTYQEVGGGTGETIDMAKVQINGDLKRIYTRNLEVCRNG